MHRRKTGEEAVDNLFWGGWEPLVKIAVIGPLGYLGVITLLRGTGKRAISKLNMFDFVMTIAMGSVLAQIFLGSKALSTGIFAFAILLVCQFTTTLFTSRSKTARNILMAPAEVIYLDGSFREEVLRRNRLTRDELEAAVRDSSCGGLGRVAAMILESDGTVSVIPTDQAGELDLVPRAAS